MILTTVTWSGFNFLMKLLTNLSEFSLIEHVLSPAVASVYGGGNDNVEAVGLKSAPVVGVIGEVFSPKPVNADNLQ